MLAIPKIALMSKMSVDTGTQLYGSHEAEMDSQGVPLCGLHISLKGPSRSNSVERMKKTYLSDPNA